MVFIVLVVFVFFFKQKTAYEMRISDWSSDVCSSDLALVVTAFKGPWRLTVEPLRDLTPDQGKVFQVWAVERGSGATRPLLQLAGGEVLRQPLDEAGWKAIAASESLSVTLEDAGAAAAAPRGPVLLDRKSTRLNSS